MKKNIASYNREKLFNLLIKEDFRTFIVNKNRGNNYIIDNPDYTSMPNAIACLERNRGWCVYETDERSKVCNEKTYTSVIEAYKDAASRSGFDFVPSKDIINIKNKTHSDYTGIPIFKIHKALTNAKEIARLMNGKPNGILAAKNVEFLTQILTNSEITPVDKNDPTISIPTFKIHSSGRRPHRANAFDRRDQLSTFQKSSLKRSSDPLCITKLLTQPTNRCAQLSTFQISSLKKSSDPLCITKLLTQPTTELIQRNSNNSKIITQQLYVTNMKNKRRKDPKRKYNKHRRYIDKRYIDKKY